MKGQVINKQEESPTKTKQSVFVWTHHRPSVYTHTHEEVFGGRLSHSEIELLLEKYPYLIDFFTIS